MTVKFKIVQSILFVFAIAHQTLTRAANLVPEALTLKDEDKNPLFSVKVDGKGNGSLSNHGATFGAPGVGGEAMIQIGIPPHVKKEDRKAWVEEAYGVALYRLDKTCSQIGSALTERGEVLAPIMEAGRVED